MRMAVVVGVLLLSPALLLQAAPKAETITGQLVDLACYSQNKQNAGVAHKGKGAICGPACTREGFPVGLVTAEGKVYQIGGELTANHQAKLAPYISQTVTVTGTVDEQNGTTMLLGSQIKPDTTP